MKPTPNEEYFVYSGMKLTKQCVVCGRPYRGEHTIPWSVGYGRYRDFPCHVKCEQDHEKESQDE